MASARARAPRPTEQAQDWPRKRCLWLRGPNHAANLVGSRQAAATTSVKAELRTWRQSDAQQSTAEGCAHPAEDAECPSSAEALAVISKSLLGGSRPPVAAAAAIVATTAATAAHAATHAPSKSPPPRRRQALASVMHLSQAPPHTCNPHRAGTLLSNVHRHAACTDHAQRRTGGRDLTPQPMRPQARSTMHTLPRR